MSNLDQALANLGAAIAANPSAAAQEAAKPKTAEVVQFPIPFPVDRPPVCNVIARTSLFAAIKGKDRRLMDKELVASQDGVEIRFSGRQWNQDDHDNFMQLVKLAGCRPLGEYIAVPANAILRALGRGTGKSQHEQLKADMHRLVSGTVSINANGINYIGHLVEDAAQDEREPIHKRHWVYRLNPKLVALFARNQFTLNNWENRLALGQKDLAKWLQLWIEGNAQQYLIAVETIRERCGSRRADLRKFRFSLRQALADLEAVGIINGWKIDEADNVHIDRTPSSSQVKHIRKKAERKPRR